MSRQTKMGRLVLRSPQEQHNRKPPRSAIDLPTVTNRPHPKVSASASYKSDLEKSSGDETSGSEFGDNYTTAKPGQEFRPRECPGRDAVRPLRSPSDQHRVIRPLEQQQVPRVLTDLQFAGEGESAVLPVRQKNGLALQTRPGSLGNTFLPEPPPNPLPGARVNDGEGPESVTSKKKGFCVPNTERNISAHTSTKRCDEFTSYPSMSQICPRAQDHTSKGIRAKQITLARAASVVNHYPQQRRRHDVEWAIDGVKYHFDPHQTSQVTRSAEADGLEGQTQLAVETDSYAQRGYVGDDNRSPACESPVTDLHKDANKTPHDRFGFEQIIGDDYHDPEPVDGGGNERQGSKTPGAGINIAGAFQNTPTRNASGGHGKRDRSNSPDRRNPQRPPTKKPLPFVEDEKGFTCVFHNSDDPDEDETQDCRTKHRFVSLLRVHHSGNRHTFNYCINCFTRFWNKAQGKAHGRCKNFKCVTEGCANYDTFDTSTCDHPTKKNSQQSVWNALVRLAHNNSLATSSVDDRPSVFSPEAGPSTPQRRIGVQLSNMNPASPSTSRGKLPAVQSSGPSLPSSGSLFKHSLEVDPCFLGLRALTRALVEYMETPDPDGLDVLHHMYSSYMGPNTRNTPAPDQHQVEVGTVQGVRTLNSMLWKAVQDPKGTSPSRVRHLLTWANDILPQRQPRNTATVTSPLERQTLPQSRAVTPTPGRREHPGNGNESAHSVHVPNLGPESQRADQSINPLIVDQFSDFNYGFHGQSIDNGLSAFNNVPHQFPDQYSEPALSYMPFTDPGSGEVYRSDGTTLSKTMTWDSGYGTGRTNNSS